MRLSASNIAWDATEDDLVARMLKDAGIDHIDLAPGKYFPDPFASTAQEIDAVRSKWQRAGFSIAGMQALLFGTTGLNLFDDRDGTMLARLARIAEIGARLGAPCMTFGSPRQRDRSGLSDARASAVATDFFLRLGDCAARHGIKVCIEPNPARYGCNFLTHTEEAALLVRALNHPYVRLQLDVGTMIINREAPGDLISTYSAEIGHVHASEPDLAELGSGLATHRQVGTALGRHRPDLVVTIEMAASPAEDHVEALERAVSIARQAYGDESIGSAANG